MTTLTDLIVWQKTIKLVTEVFSLTSTFPKEESFTIKSQIKRSGISILSNISEGYECLYRYEFIRFLYIAKDSLYELQSQLKISGTLNFIELKTLKSLLDKCIEVEQLINNLINKIEQNKEIS